KAREMHGQKAERRNIFEREIAIADGVETVGGDARETQIARQSFAVERKCAAGKRAGAERAGIGAGCGGGDALGVAMKRFTVRQAPMRNEQRLGVLEMRGAGHGDAQIGFSLRGERAQQRRKRATNLMRGFFHVHAEFGGHHFVAAAAGVQLGAQVAELFDQRGFHEMVNVFGFRVVKPGRLGLRAALELVERGDYLLSFFVRENSGGGDGARPGPVEREFLWEKAAIEMPGALEFVEGGVRGTVKAAAPHLLVFGAAHLTSAFARATFGTVTGGTVMGSAKRLMKPSASLGLYPAMVKLARLVR